MIKFIKERLRRRRVIKKVMLLADLMTLDQVIALRVWMRNNKDKNGDQILAYIDSGALDEVGK